MADLVKFANDYKNNPNATAVLITFMGDGMPAFMTESFKRTGTVGPGISADHHSCGALVNLMAKTR
jgi:hypothetical protein